ncbi:MAG: hypothetical protein SFX73_10330 [Kofleriaceae bacterium]|nr:hypothetical protein [Kofleriaceae bacterium]
MTTPLVADAIAHYDELLSGRFEPASWWPEHRDTVLRHWVEEAPMSAFVLRPRMVDEATYASVKASVALVLRGVMIATDRLATDESLRRAIKIPAYLEPLLELDRTIGKPSILGRIDGHMANDGCVKFIEFNAQPLSAAFQYELERSFARLPISSEFEKRFRVRSVDLYERLHSALNARSRDGRTPCTAIVDKALWRSPRRASHFRPLMYCSARGAPVLYVDPEELDYRNGKLTANGIQVDVIAFPNWDLLINARKRLVKILKAVADGAVDVFGGVSRGLLASYKATFELLSSPEHRELFPPEVNEALARHIPWTRVLGERKTSLGGTEVDLLPFVAAHREQLVIKPAGGSGGQNIHIGRDLTDDAWTQAIHKGVAQNWIVQALALPERQAFPAVRIASDGRGEVGTHELNCELTPYVWNGTQAEGVLSRVVAGSVISDLGDQPIGLANGVETATWIIDRK